MNQIVCRVCDKVIEHDVRDKVVEHLQGHLNNGGFQAWESFIGLCTWNLAVKAEDSGHGGED